MEESDKVIPPVDLNKPVENPLLKGAIEKFLNGNHEKFNEEIISCLQQANYLLPTLNFPEPSALEQGKPQFKIAKGSQIALFNVIKNNKKFLAVFTDWEEIRRYTNKNVSTLVMPGKDLCSFVLKQGVNDGVVINVAGRPLGLSKEHLEFILNFKGSESQH